MNVQYVVLDYETFFTDVEDERGRKYSLKHLTTEDYIRHPWFEAHGAAVKWSPEQPAVWYDEPELRSVLREHDWSDTFLIAHHAQFDGFILNHHFDVCPRAWGCTLSMARLLLGNHLSVSLDAVRAHFGIPAKSTPYNLFKGKHWREMDRVTQDAVAAGACDEVESIWRVFNLLARDFPKEEYAVVDATIRMFTEPVLRGDLDMLAKVWQDEAVKKQDRLTKLGVTEGDLQSADRFAALLRERGVEPETKQSPKGNTIYAFAKNDQFMRDLQEDDDDDIRTLAEARLGVKSTLMQTRAETLGWMGSRGSCPVYLRYAGAGTLRVSGGDGANWLNFKRGSQIRKSIMAPEGYLLGPVDLSQIEFRVCMWLAGQEDVLDQLRRGEDPYIGIASEFYGEAIYKPAKDDPRRLEMEQKRGTGKQAKLMCQYGAGGEQFQKTAKGGLYGPPIDMSRDEADRFVALYRRTHPAVCAPHTGYWAQASRVISRLAGGGVQQWGPLLVRDRRIYLPNGCPLIYDTLEYHTPSPEECEKLPERKHRGFWRVRTRNGWKEMWGSKLVQNVCEAVSRVIASQAMIRLQHLGYRTLNWPYDELLLLLPDDGRADEHERICLAEMRREVSWLPGLPIDAEMTVAERYSK